MSRARANPTGSSWSTVKASLAGYDRAGLISLLKDLYGSSRESHAFLDARLGLGADPLAPYKKTISRWINPDVTRGQDISVSKAKKAISDYRKAIGHPIGMAELAVFYCEEAQLLLSDCGIDDEGFRRNVTTMLRSCTVSGNLPMPASSFGHQVENGRGSLSSPSHLTTNAVAAVKPEFRTPRISSLSRKKLSASSTNSVGPHFSTLL